MNSVALRLNVLIILLASASALHAVPAPPAPVDDWIEQLGHGDAGRRNEAKLKLQRLGEPALAKVQKAAKEHTSQLVRAMATDVAACIQRGEILLIGSGASYWFNRAVFCDDGRHALVTGGALIIMDLLEAKEVGRDLELQYARLGLAITRDGKHYATGHQGDVNVRIGEVKSGKVTKVLEGHKGGVFGLAFSPKGDRLVSGSVDNSLRLWDIAQGKELKQFPGITDHIRSADYSSDGKRILSGHWGPRSAFLVRLWDVEEGKEIRSFKGHARDVSAVFFLSDCKSAVSTGMDGVAFVWNLEDGKEIRRMNHNGGIYGAAVSNDGKRLLTAGYGDQTVRLWEIENGKELKSFPNHGAAALGVAFSKDGQYALSTDARATVRMWRLPK